jgi:hypothetical protein
LLVIQGTAASAPAARISAQYTAGPSGAVTMKSRSARSLVDRRHAVPDRRRVSVGRVAADVQRHRSATVN